MRVLHLIKIEGTALCRSEFGMHGRHESEADIFMEVLGGSGANS